jgi:hypothetical protein
VPFTPFHFGPGAALKAVAPRHFSFTVFAFTNVAIDVEPLVYLMADDYPVHRLFHTYAGATLAAVVCALAGRPVCSWAIRAWNGRLSEAQARRLALDPRIGALPAAIGAAAGAWSHVLLDSLMHADMRPLAPFSDGGGMSHLVTFAQIQGFCILSGALGVAALLAAAVLRRKAGGG